MAEPTGFTSESYIETINELDNQLAEYFGDVLKLDIRLNRRLVSFQANKDRPAYRWYKFKEAFSADLVENLLKRFSIPKGKVLDPFAGSGTTLFASADLGYDADGIELLPIGQQIIECRKYLAFEISEDVKDIFNYWRNSKPWEKAKPIKAINTLRITEGAYPKKTEEDIRRFLAQTEQEKSKVADILRFASVSQI